MTKKLKKFKTKNLPRNIMDGILLTTKLYYSHVLVFQKSASWRAESQHLFLPIEPNLGIYTGFSLLDA